MFELFHFQLHATLIGIYQNFQGGGKESPRGGKCPPRPPPPRLNPGHIICSPRLSITFLPLTKHLSQFTIYIIDNSCICVHSFLAKTTYNRYNTSYIIFMLSNAPGACI